MLFPAGTRSETSPSVEAILDGWLAAQTGLETWSAHVVQTRKFKTLAQPLVSRGQIWIRPPDQFRWELGQPTATLAIRQPEAMVVIYPGLKRVERFPIDPNHRTQPWSQALSLMEAGFPRTRGDIEEMFRVTAPQKLVDGWSIMMEPRRMSVRRWMSGIVIELGAADYGLRATELRFSDGSAVRNEFTHIQRNKPMDSALFSPEIPEDFEVIDPVAP